MQNCRNVVTALAAVFLAVGGSGAVRAQPVTGLYVAGAAGINLLQAEAFHQYGVGPGVSAPDYNNSGVGFAGLGSVGYGFGNGVRVEVEAQYLSNGLNGPADGTALSVGGTQGGVGLFANLFYDFDFGLRYVFPYVGLGIGNEWTMLQNLRSSGRGAPLNVNGTSDNFAYQGIIGIAVPVPALPRLSLTVDYRLLGVVGPEQAVAATGGSGNLATHGSATIGNEFHHEVVVGARYAF